MVLLTSDLKQCGFGNLIKLPVILAGRKARPYMRGNQINAGNKMYFYERKKISAKIKFQIRDRRLRDDLIVSLHTLVFIIYYKNMKYDLFFSTCKEDM